MTDENLEILTPEERIVVEFYRSLDDNMKQALWDLMQAVYAARREAPS